MIDTSDLTIDEVVQRIVVAVGTRSRYADGMAPLRSKVTAQGRTSIPAEIRRKLGIGPGSVVQWDQDGLRLIVRRIGRYSSEDIQRDVYPGDDDAPEN